MRMPPGNLTSTTTAKSMTGMPAGTPLWKAGWTTWKKSGKGRKFSMTFSAPSSRDLARRKNCRWISTRSCSIGLWITQRSIRTAGWCSPSAMVWKSAQRSEREQRAGSGDFRTSCPLFFVRGKCLSNKVFFCMEICKDLRYNFHISCACNQSLLSKCFLNNFNNAVQRGEFG